MKGIPAPEIRFSDIEAGCNAILKRCPDTWNARDIYRRLKEERAFLYRDESGFVVLEKCTDPFSVESYLNVWLMYFHPGTGVGKREALLDWLDETAKQARCEWIQFTSPREEWAGMIKDKFEKKATVWRRHVNRG